MKLTKQKISNTNDDYMNTIYAIMGFMNIYSFELKKNGIDVLVFQGRRLDKSNPKGNIVTPDVGVLDSENSGVIGEVKNNFNSEEQYWIKSFEQLLKYDDDLIGWPNKSETVQSHDIVLLVHESRSRKVRDYYLSKKDSEIKFNRPFIIIEYGRSDQGKQYFKFRIEHGTLTNTTIHNKFYNLVQYPMDVFVTQYSCVKLYDGKPHLSWMLLCIHQCMVDKATADGIFVKLGKNTKLPLKTSIDEIITILRDNYSFKQLTGAHPERQPNPPSKEWVVEAVEKLISVGEIKSKDGAYKELTYFLKRHENMSAKDYYETICLDTPMDDNQLSLGLFGDEK